MGSALTSVQVHLIDENSFNIRKTFDKTALAELADSIRAKGVMQPLELRKSAEDSTRYTVIFGHRRLRAAKLAGLAEVPAIIMNGAFGYDEKEVIERQAIENLQREGIDGFEEGLAYAELKNLGLTPEQIAEKTGRTKSTVYARLKLAELSKEARHIAQEHGVDDSQALEVARIVGAKAQAEAMKKIATGGLDKKPMSFRDAKNYVETEWMLLLVKAPFDVKDAKLTSAGACKACPKRSGNADPNAKNPNVCTDRACFREKCIANWRQAQNAWTEAGGKVLKEDVWAEYGDALKYGSGYIDTRSQYFSKTDKKDMGRRTLLQVLDMKKPEVLALLVLSNSPSGAVVHLIEEKHLPKALELSGVQGAVKRGDKRQKAASKAEKAKEKKQEILEMTTDFLFAEAVAEAASEKADAKALWILLLNAEIEYCDPPTKEIFDRRGWDAKDARKKLDAMTAKQLRGLFVEMRFGQDIYRRPGLAVEGDYRKDLASALNIDLKDTERRAKASIAELTAKAEAIEKSEAKK